MIRRDGREKKVVLDAFGWEIKVCVRYYCHSPVVILLIAASLYRNCEHASSSPLPHPSVSPKAPAPDGRTPNSRLHHLESDFCMYDVLSNGLLMALVSGLAIDCVFKGDAVGQGRDMG